MIFTVLFALSGSSILLSVSLFIFYKFSTVLNRFKECPHCKGHIHETVKVGKFEYTRCKSCLYPNLENEYENKLISMGTPSNVVSNTKLVVHNPILIQNLRNRNQIEFSTKIQLPDFQRTESLA